VVWLRAASLWLIHDRLEGRGPHAFRQYWHFPGDGVLEDVDAGGFLVKRPDGAPVRLQLLGAGGDGLDVRRGDRDAGWSWESPAYGELRPRLSVCRAWTADLSAGASTRSTVLAPSPSVAVEGAVIDSTNALIATLEGGFRLVLDAAGACGVEPA
jgi:hypothetical protein